MESNRANSIGLSVVELNGIDGHAKDFDQMLKKIERDIKQETDAAEKGKRRADPALLRRLQGERYLAIAAAMFRIRSQLTPAGWNNLRSFLNNEYRFTIRVIDLEKN